MDRQRNPIVTFYIYIAATATAAAAKLLQSYPTLRPHRWQPTRLPRPWDSPGKNTGVDRHFLLQYLLKIYLLLYVIIYFPYDIIVFYMLSFLPPGIILKSSFIYFMFVVLYSFFWCFCLCQILIDCELYLCRLWGLAFVQNISDNGLGSQPAERAV